MKVSNILFCVLILFIWSVKGKNVHRESGGLYGKIEASYEKKNEESSSMESEYEPHETDVSSYSGYEHSHEMIAKTKNKTRKQRATLNNCGGTVNIECCPEKENAAGAEETNEGTVGGSCRCRCSEPPVDTNGDSIAVDEAATKPSFCPKGKGSWPGLKPAVRKSSRGNITPP